MQDAVILQELGISSADVRTDEDLLRALEPRLDAMLRADPERLARTLYRLDVDEHAADTAIASAANAPAALARLVVERIRRKAAARAASSPQPPDGSEPDLLL